MHAEIEIGKAIVELPQLAVRQFEKSVLNCYVCFFKLDDVVPIV